MPPFVGAGRATVASFDVDDGSVALLDTVIVTDDDTASAAIARAATFSDWAERTTVGGLTLASTSSVDFAPLAKVPGSVQVTGLWPAAVHVHAGEAGALNTSGAGRSIVTATPSATPGPALATTADK